MIASIQIKTKKNEPTKKPLSQKKSTGTQGLINPRARRRQVGSAEFSMPRALGSLGQSLNARAAEKESEETEEANNELQSGGVPYAQAFDDGSGGESSALSTKMVRSIALVNRGA